MPKKFLTVKEVARLVGVTPLTVRNWDQKGKLSAYRNPFNNYRLYKVEDVENLMKEIDQSQGQSKGNQPVTAQVVSEPEPPKPKKLTIDIL